MFPLVRSVVSLLAACVASAAPAQALLAPADQQATSASGDLLRTRETQANPAALAALSPGSVLPFALFDDAVFTCEVTTVVAGPIGSFTIQGRIPGDAMGAFTITVEQGNISGGLWCSRGVFGLAPTGRASEDCSPIIEVREWAPGAAVRCAMTNDRDLIAPADTRLLRRYQTQPITPNTSVTDGLQASPSSPASPAPPGSPSNTDRFPLDPHEPNGPAYAMGGCSCADDQSSLDVMFVYTTLAKNAAGGAAALQARVNDAIASCNLAFTQSGINAATPGNRLQVRSAGFAEITYNEVSPNWLDHLSRLANPTDGFVDQAITLRDQFHADTVCLIVEDARFTGGAGFYAVYVRDSAATVLNWRAMGGGSLTFAHECGHNFGCAHDRGNSSFSLFTYAWGHWFAANNTTYGTIMSYTGAILLPRFSNPNIIHSSGRPEGVALNQPLPAYNALAISQSKWVLTSYGDSGRITDCNNNGFEDRADIETGRSQDENENCRPDECEYRVYVDANNTGAIDGLSWNTAYRDLGEAMTFASLNCNNVSEIWVADGVYKPDRSSADRYARFELRGGLALYGGFQGKSRPSGGEMSDKQRMFIPGVGMAFPSILSGDIGTPGVATDNSFNVVTAVDCGANTILNGFTIENGYQDFDGAGMWISNGRPTILKCTFRNNRGGGSGAIGIFGPMSDPLIAGCIFDSNTALSSGGSVGIVDNADATFDTCIFRNSTATYGGAARLHNGAAAVFRACTFEDNTASIGSGAIDCYFNAKLTLDSCQLRRNRALDGSGGAITLHTGCTGIFTYTTLADNTARYTGGAVWMQASLSTISDCHFTMNNTGDGGGALSGYDASVLTADRCTFSDNSARWGGALVINSSLFTIRNCTLHHNSTLEYSGGGIDAYEAFGFTLINSSLTANESADGGGGISLGTNSDLSVVNCTFADNHAVNWGGGIGMYDASLAVANSILWGNTADIGYPIQDRQLTVFSGTRYVNFSCVQGLTGSLGGAGNIGADPLLTDAAAGDVALSSGSPCIDAASNTLLPIGATTDLLGADRRFDDPSTADTGIGTAPIVDMGAVEFAPSTQMCPADFNQDGGIDGGDVESFFVAWEAGDATADVNQDGGIDGADVATFFIAWENGGC